MKIPFAIHTYGHMDAMYFTLNAIKMVMNSDFAGALIKLIALVATSVYAIKGMLRAHEGLTGHFLLKTLGMSLVIQGLLVPKADMLVVDRISGKKEVVSDLPYAFVLPVGALEAIGAGITSLFEQAFSPVSSMPFKDYGMVFGHRLVHESKNWRIANPQFVSNMNSFIKRCVVLEAMIGTRFTPADIKESDDIFQLVTENAGTFRTIDFVDGPKSNRKYRRITCKEAGAALKQAFVPEYERIIKKYFKSDFSVAGNHSGNGRINSALKKNLELAYSSTLGVTDSATNILRQNMMINALKDFNNKSDKYGYTRAEMLQKSNWGISGALAKEYIPMFLNIMKALVYSSFIFVVPLMILSGGMSHYLKYCTVIFSLQIWPALNAVLNLFIELYSNISFSSQIDGGLSYGNFLKVHDQIDTIVLIAGSLQLSIPFLSFAIVQGGVGSFVHLASSLQGASSSAASIAAGEVTSGNRSFDNVSQNTASIGNKSGFKTDWNQQYQQRAIQVMNSDGSLVKTFADGSSSVTSGAGINTSSGMSSFSMENSKNIALSDSISQGMSAIKSDEQHYQESQTAAMSTATDRVSHLAQKLHAGETVNFDTSTEEGRAMQQAVNNTVSLHDKEGYDWNQSARGAVSSYAKAGVKSPLPIFSGEMGIDTTGTVSAENNSSQSLDKDSGISRENNTNHNLNTLMKAASNSSYTTDDTIDQSLADSTRASYEKMQSYGESIAHRKEELEQYQQAYQANQAQGATDRVEKYHDLEQNIMQRYGVSQDAAHQMIERRDKRAIAAWNDMVSAEIGQDIANIKQGQTSIANNALQTSGEFKNQHSGKITNQAQDELRAKASADGLDQNAMKEKMAGTEQNLRSKQTDMTQHAKNQIHSIEHHNKTMEQGMEQKRSKYEEDRIGQGRTSKLVGTLAQLPTVGRAGDRNVGGPKNQQRLQEYIKKNDKK